MKIFIALALVSLLALPGCIYAGSGHGRGYYAQDHRSHYDRDHRDHRDYRGRW